MSSTSLLLGDEAIAQAAIDAGLSGCYAYPGTPSTEIMEYIQHSPEAAKRNIHRQWSSNEKTAMEAAMGMSYAGKRAIVCFKHVGLNVAADAFMNSAITGVNGGLVIVSADDPSMHSSQNEQDSRFYGKFALIPVIEPSSQQEAYDMTYEAFDLSEKYRIPVLLRITTRMAHSRANVTGKAVKSQNKLNPVSDLRQFTLLPANARRNYASLLEKQADFEKEAEQSTYNSFTQGSDKSLGIIACGIAYNYLMENYPNRKCPYSIVKITQYPLPHKHIEKLYNESEQLLIIEEGYPLIEEQIKGFLNLGKPIKGRLDGSLPRTGELNTTLVAKALGLTVPEPQTIPDIVAPRPPSLCPGCGHRDVSAFLAELIKAQPNTRIFGDIGCYTLTAIPPFNTLHTCLDMGASITMAKGAADAGLHPSVAIIGDSTFTHSGMTGLLDAITENSNITVIISDNYTTGMTGGQFSLATNRLAQICKGLGVSKKHLKLIIPLKKHHEENLQTLNDEIAYNGLSVIIAQRECVQTFAKKAREKRKEEKTE